MNIYEIALKLKDLKKAATVSQRWFSTQSVPVKVTFEWHRPQQNMVCISVENRQTLWRILLKTDFITL